MLIFGGSKQLQVNKLPPPQKRERGKRYRFNANTRNPPDGKWGEYAINKRALADAIVELMEKVK